MFTLLDGCEGDVLAVEISGGYVKEDVAAFTKAFENVLAAGHDRVNILVKLDRMKITESQFGAFVEDARYALRSLEKMRHIAVVGHGGIQAFLIKMDNLLFGKPEKERVEKFFDIDELDKAWAFVRS